MSLKRGFSNIGKFLILNIIFFVFTFPLVILHGPFPNVRNAVEGAVATSMHRSLLRYFLSDAEYNRLIASAAGIINASGKINPARFTNRHNSNIKMIKINSSRFTGYLLEISDPTRVQIGVAESLGERGQTVSEIAKANDATAAVNAGGFDDPNGTGNGKLPIGVIIHNGYFLVGENLSGKINLVGLTRWGGLVTGSYTVNEMKEMKIAEGISFGPPLILNGEKQVTNSTSNAWGIGPRTAIGQKSDGTILLLVIDGRQPGYSYGATLLDLQNILYQNGAETAANLDGGSSATMFYNGKVVNRPCDLLGERSVPTAFIVK